VVRIRTRAVSLHGLDDVLLAFSVEESSLQNRERGEDVISIVRFRVDKDQGKVFALDVKK